MAEFSDGVDGDAGLDRCLDGDANEAPARRKRRRAHGGDEQCPLDEGPWTLVF